MSIRWWKDGADKNINEKQDSCENDLLHDLHTTSVASEESHLATKCFVTEEMKMFNIKSSIPTPRRSPPLSPPEQLCTRQWLLHWDVCWDRKGHRTGFCYIWWLQRQVEIARNMLSQDTGQTKQALGVQGGAYSLLSQLEGTNLEQDMLFKYFSVNV